MASCNVNAKVNSLRALISFSVGWANTGFALVSLNGLCKRVMSYAAWSSSPAKNINFF